MPVAAAPVQQEPAFDSAANTSAADPISANGSAIDAHFGADSPLLTATPGDEIDALAEAMNVGKAEAAGEMAGMHGANADAEDADDDLMAQLAADLAVKAPVDMAATGSGSVDFDEVRAEAFEAAPFSIDLPVSPVIDVDVPGLDVPRQLEREAMDRKLVELRARGLAAVQAADLAADLDSRV